MSSLAILDERKDLDEVELSGLVIDQDAIPRLAAWAQSSAGAARLRVGRIKAGAIKLAIRDVEMPSLDAVVTFGNDGAWQKLSVRDGKATLELLPSEGARRVARELYRPQLAPAGRTAIRVRRTFCDRHVKPRTGYRQRNQGPRV